MNLLQKRFIGPPVEVMRLDILMQYYLKLGSGTAALRWTDPMGGGPLIQAHLVALLYGRVLRIHHETRKGLFSRVGDLALKNVRSKGAAGFDFSPWVIHADSGGDDYTLWPWLIIPPEQITAPKVYTATLKHGEPSSLSPSGMWIDLDVVLGQERIFVPSAALIAISGFSKACDRKTRFLLARLLWQMNLFWVSPNMVSFFSETLAYAAAYSAIRSGPFRIP